MSAFSSPMEPVVDIQGEKQSLLDKPHGAQVANLRSASTFRAFLNITKCFIGAASFELPWAFSQAGLAGGIVGIFVLALFSNYTLRILATCGHLTDKKNPTYPEIGEEAFGTVGKVLAWIGIISMTVGVCGSYLVFIGSSISEMIIQYDHHLTTTACTLLVLPIIVGLSWARSYKFLAPTSAMGCLALLFSVTVTMYYTIKHETITTFSEPNIKIEWWKTTTYPLFIGNAAFLYLIHSVILPTEQSMKDYSKYGLALNSSMVFVTVLNLIFAALMYMYWGDEVDQNIIKNLSSGVVTTLVKIFLSVDLLFTYALFMFPVSESLEVELFKGDQFGTWKVELKRNILRALLVAATAAIALAIPFFALLTGLSGGLGNNVLGFILPPIFYIKLQYNRGYWKWKSHDNDTGRKPLYVVAEIFLCWFIFVLGLVVFVLTAISFTNAVIDERKH